MRNGKSARESVPDDPSRDVVRQGVTLVHDALRGLRTVIARADGECQCRTFAFGVVLRSDEDVEPAAFGDPLAGEDTVQLSIAVLDLGEDLLRRGVVADGQVGV